MKYCSECGFKLESYDKFCPECGTPVIKIDSSQKRHDYSPEQEYKTKKRDNISSYGILNLENLPEGHIITDRYVIKEKVGQGGFGAVYRVFDQNMEIEKALKIIPEAIINDDEALFDLQREAKTMISLHHANIVQIYDFHRTGEIKFIDMEYLDGKTLTQLKLEHSNKQMPEKQVKEYAVKIAEGMAYAHDNGVLHKDIKPQNIKVTSKGIIKIMDFGIADTVRTSMSRLQNSSSSGTLVYMSPEQLKGKEIGKESDIYSFGAMLYELLSGKPPFYKGAIDHQILNVEPNRILHATGFTNDLLMKCLEKDYRKRFKDFSEVIEELEVDSEQSKVEEVKMIASPVEENIGEFPIEQTDSLIKRKSLFENIISHICRKTRYITLTLLTLTLISLITYLVYSNNQNRVTVPELQGLTIEEARTTLINAGLDLGKVIERYDSNNVGIVINSSPSTGTARIGSSVNLLVGLDYKRSQVSGIELVFVKGGSFMMGSHKGSADERPVHRVKLRDFYIGKNEVTQKQWQEVMGTNPSSSIGLDLPVERVSWYDVIGFCNLLSVKEGLIPVYSIKSNTNPTNWSFGTVMANWDANGYRLPTEAEWEYAARGGSISKDYIFSGSNSINDVAWFSINSNERTQPVGSKRANELGIYDMSGNVWEWCWDRNAEYTASFKVNPRGPDHGTQAVLRGGSYFDGSSRNRVTGRGKYYRDHSGANTGFRVAKNE